MGKIDKKALKQAIDNYEDDAIVVLTKRFTFVNGSKPDIMSAITISLRTMIEDEQFTKSDLAMIFKLATATDDEIVKEALKTSKELLNKIGMKLE